MLTLQNPQVPKMRVKPDRMAVLITGCDTGFGNLLARKLDKAGFKVLACCLFPNGDGAKQLSADCSSKLKIIKLDVTSDEDVERAYECVEKELESSKHGKQMARPLQYVDRCCHILTTLCLSRATCCREQCGHPGYR